tara:strand:- start:624 stop:2315 length:1692 start_codon:yes stop_codon:yes gene_type:complete
MLKVRELAKGDVIVPLNELDQNAKASVANLLSVGLDQMSMRVASTMPHPYFPPMKEGSQRSKEMASLRHKAMLSMWDHNRMNMKLRRRARHLLGYSMSPIVVKPDFRHNTPKWHLRNPLDTYAAPGEDPDNPVPENVIFRYSKPYSWLIQNYGPQVDGRLRVGRPEPDTQFTLLEYVCDNEIVVGVLGAEDDPNLNYIERAGMEVLELERIPNRAGVPLVVIPQRITLDTPRGQFDDMLGMFYTRARLQALTEIAIERGIFPDEYLVARPGENPEIIALADGKRGELGIIKGGDLQIQQVNPGYKTDTALDRIERQERLEGAIPAEFGGESGTNIRTGRRGENVLSAVVDYRVQEAQDLFASSLLEEDKVAIAIEKAYFGSQPKSFFMPGRAQSGKVDYTPNKIWETDFHYVSYSASGSDVNNLIIGLGQRMGTGMMSKESAREADPLINDPELEHDRITSEGIEAALLASIQQQAANPNGPYQPADLASLTKKVMVEKKSLFDAVNEVDEEARERQATEAEAMAPETMPGLAMPGMGAEQPTAPPPQPGEGGIEALLAQLGA